jgi:hypothetical protein
MAGICHRLAKGSKLIRFQARWGFGGFVGKCATLAIFIVQPWSIVLEPVPTT